MTYAVSQRVPIDLRQSFCIDFVPRHPIRLKQGSEDHEVRSEMRVYSNDPASVNVESDSVDERHP